MAPSRPVFERDAARVTESARRVVPRLVQLARPHSAVDLGCGTGDWLEALAEAGVSELWGVDRWPPAPLRCGAQLLEADLRRPLQLQQRFDLALCLEVGEHLPPAAAPQLIRSLCQLSPVVLFSAAIPHQGGRNHVNEQWPGYWCQLFRARGFVPLDLLRPELWDDVRVLFYYAQNMVLYVDPSGLPAHSPLRPICRAAQQDALPQGSRRPGSLPADPLPLVHPALHLRHQRQRRSWLHGAARRAWWLMARRHGGTGG